MAHKEIQQIGRNAFPEHVIDIKDDHGPSGEQGLLGEEPKDLILSISEYQDRETKAEDFKKPRVRKLTAHKGSVHHQLEQAEVRRLSSHDSKLKAVKNFVMAEVNELLRATAAQHLPFPVTPVPVPDPTDDIQASVPDEIHFLCEMSALPAITAIPRPQPGPSQSDPRNANSYYELRVAENVPWTNKHPANILHANSVKTDFFNALRNAMQGSDRYMIRKDTVGIGGRSGARFDFLLKIPFAWEGNDCHKQLSYISQDSFNLTVAVGLVLAVPAQLNVLPKSTVTEAVKEGGCKGCHFIPTDGSLWKLSFAKFESLSVQNMSAGAKTRLVALKVHVLFVSLSILRIQ